jgi:hypothetical protein
MAGVGRDLTEIIYKINYPIFYTHSDNFVNIFNFVITVENISECLPS